MELIEVEIVNWGKHQPRKDIKHPTWFAMSNRIFEDSKLFSLSDAQWRCLLYLFTQASQQNSGKIKINVEHAARIGGTSEKVLKSTISRLCDVGVTSAYAIRTDTLRDTTLQDTTRHNTTLVCTVAESAPAPTIGFLGKFDQKTLDSWKTLYGEDYVTREAMKAEVWCRANPAKSPKKSWVRFFAGWLERGWDSYRKSLPTSPASSIDWSKFSDPGASA